MNVDKIRRESHEKMMAKSAHYRRADSRARYMAINPNNQTLATWANHMRLMLTEPNGILNDS